MANKYMKKCSASLVIKEMQVRTTLLDHLTPVGMVIIKKEKMLARMQRKGTLIHFS
jgi:hypothetical protein